MSDSMWEGWVVPSPLQWELKKQNKKQTNIVSPVNRTTILKKI